MSLEQLQAKMKNPENSIVIFDLSSNGEPLGRVFFELYMDDCPRTAENFRALCTGEVSDCHFLGSKFHRVIPDFVCQGGDFTRGDGTGGRSIYGGKFEDENFTHPHDRPGLLSMANAGPNTNGSQFFVTLRATPHLNGKHCVFGKVIDGMAVVREVEKCGSSPRGTTTKQIKIEWCGQFA